MKGSEFTKRKMKLTSTIAINFRMPILPKQLTREFRQKQSQASKWGLARTHTSTERGSRCN